MRQLIALAGILLLAGACNKDDAGPLRKFMSFKVDDQIMLSENPVALITPGDTSDSDPNNDYPTAVISGVNKQGDAITFTLISENATFVPGSYPSSQQGNSMYITFAGNGASLLADDTHGSLDFRINLVHDSLIEASFSGTLVDTTGALSDKVLSEGFMRAILRTK